VYGALRAKEKKKRQQEMPESGEIRMLQDGAPDSEKKNSGREKGGGDFGKGGEEANGSVLKLPGLKGLRTNEETRAI